MDKNIIKESKGIRYVEAGKEDGPVLMLLHGLFGALSNFEALIDYFKPNYRVAVPLLPLYQLPVKEVSLEAYVDYVRKYVDMMGYEKVNVMGNSLGGHIALLYTFDFPEKVNSLILTGSSGLFENSLGGTYPRRGDYDFIKTKTEATFYDPKVATKELVDEVFDIINDRNKLVRVIATSKSAIRNNVESRLKEIEAPTLLIWGQQDTITPPFVGEKFQEGIKNARLELIDQCGHAPMMERPQEFNHVLGEFLEEVTQ